MCDDWLANNDRNLGNLLELPNKTFTLIDHGGILYGDNWSPWDIMRNHVINGPFHKMYVDIFRQKFTGLFWKENLLSELEVVKREHEDSFKLIKDEASQLISDFLGEEKVDIGIPPNPVQHVCKILEDFLSTNSMHIGNIEAKCDIWLSTPHSLASQ